MANAAAPPRPPVAPPRPQVGPPGQPRPQPQVPQVPQMQNVAVDPPGQPRPQPQVSNLAPPLSPTQPTQPAVAQPVEQKVKRRPGRKAETLPPYYGLFVYDAAGNPVMITGADGSQFAQRQKLSALPADYDPTKSARLKPSDFENELVFLEYQISVTERKLAGMRANYETIKKLGVGAGAKAASNLLKYQKQFAGMRAQLEAQGIDVEALLAAGANS